MNERIQIESEPLYLSHLQHTHTHSLGHMSERERQKLWRSSLCFGLFYFGVDSISEKVARFFPLWFPRGKLFVSLVSCDVLMFYCCACYSLS